MQTLGDTRRHMFLFKRMARATGADISGLEDEAWAAAVSRCRGCACPGLCEDRLTAAELGEERLDPPAFCENRDLLGSLSDKSVEGAA